MTARRTFRAGVIQRSVVAALAGTALLAAGGCKQGGAADPATDRHGAAMMKLDAMALYVTGAKAAEQGDRAGAIRALEASVRADGKQVSARELLGDLYAADREWAKASEQYAAVARLDPYGAVNFRKLGDAQQRLNRPREAAANYEQAVKLDPNDAKAYMGLSLARLSSGQVKEAVEPARRASQLANQDATVWATLGAALDAAGELSDAEGAYRKSLQLNPDQPTVKRNLQSNLQAQAAARAGKQ